MKNLSTMQVAKLAVIYKLCAGVCSISELSDDEKIYVATCLQRCKNTSRGENERWAIDWAAIGLSKLGSKDRDGIWKEVAQIAMGHPVIKTSLARKTITADWDAFEKLTPELLEHLDRDETSFQNVYNIYEATGKVVHKRQIEKLESDSIEGNTATKIIDMMKKLNPTIPQMAQIQKYMNISIRNKTGAVRAKFMLPEMLFAKRKELHAKKLSLIPAQSYKADTEEVIANLGLMGYRLAIVKPEFSKQEDIKFFKRVEFLDPYQAQQLNEDELLGLAHHDYANKPTQTFRYTTGDTRKSLLTAKDYLDAIVSRYNKYKDIIKQYTTTPKAFYISNEPDKPYEWNYEAIALDIYCNENIAINPDTFILLKHIFQDKEPVEWLNEV